MMSDILGVILCGGKSSRMGADKGLIKLHASTWAQTAVDKLSTLQLRVVLSVNTVQYSDYTSIFEPGRLIRDNPALDISGPLAGVLSVHLQYPANDLLVLACDMPLMEAAMLRQLYSACQLHPSTDAFVFTNDGEPEPLCAVYTTRGLEQIYRLLEAKALTRHSMKFVLEHLSTLKMPLEEEQKKYFRNFNAHAEINGL